MKRKWLPAGKLYLILDRQVNTDNRLFEIAEQAVRFGADVIQLRDKTGSARDTLKCFEGIARATKRRVPLIINDRVDLALVAGADGVHLGQEDIMLKDARRIIGRQSAIGISCQTYEQARQAEREGADYIGFGSVFKTLTKPERAPMDPALLARVVRDMKIPVFAIGGINAGNMAVLRDTGVRRFAVCRAICEARDIKKAVSNIKKEISGQGSLNLRG
ncbi:MAG: thiamine phosphate synthase [Candidatus Omnitrophica bacterium]|nr:thiamine phosphate synthase [Candidatus Omnitrophota bacterium]